VTGCRRGERQSGRITLFGRQHGHRDRRPAGVVGAVPSGESCSLSPFIGRVCVFSPRLRKKGRHGGGFSTFFHRCFRRRGGFLSIAAAITMKTHPRMPKSRRDEPDAALPSPGCQSASPSASSDCTRCVAIPFGKWLKSTEKYLSFFSDDVTLANTEFASITPNCVEHDDTRWLSPYKTKRMLNHEFIFFIHEYKY